MLFLSNLANGNGSNVYQNPTKKEQNLMNKGSELCSLKSFRRKLFCDQVLQIRFRPNLFVVYTRSIHIKLT